MGEGTSYSCSSSIDSSSYPPLSFSSPDQASSSSACPSTDNYVDQPRRVLNTDLRLGLCSLPANKDVSSSPKHRKQRIDWPPIEPHLRNTLTKKTADSRQHASAFVKVYMEGIPIGRKLNLLSHDGYHELIASLTYMFKTTILCPDAERINSDQHYVLTYEDKEGDWMMVGDVPWELFLTNVRRLKITRADRC